MRVSCHKSTSVRLRACVCIHACICALACVCLCVWQAVGLPDWSIASHLAQLTLHPKTSALFPSSNSTQDVPHSRESVTLLKTYTHCSLLTGCSLSHTHTHTHLNPFAMNHSLFLSEHTYTCHPWQLKTEKQLMVLMRNCFPHKCFFNYMKHLFENKFYK